MFPVFIRELISLLALTVINLVNLIGKIKNYLKKDPHNVPGMIFYHNICIIALFFYVYVDKEAILTMKHWISHNNAHNLD